MLKISFFIYLLVFLFFPITTVIAKYDNIIKVFTWSGYVQSDEIREVNKILKEKGYNYTVNVIQPWAEGPQQMFNILRKKQADISFITLNYIKMQGGKTLRLLQPIDINSPRLTNYKYLLKELKNIPMGMEGGKHYYIPWGGGAYGIWANMKKINENEKPKSITELWDSKWTGKLSLTRGQIQPNIALSMLALNKPPFYLNEIVNNNDLLSKEIKKNGKIQLKTDALYKQVAYFWNTTPEFKDNLLLVASYGPGVFAENSKGGNWQLINFKEGNTVWLDTINFHNSLKGKKLEAAEIFLNYFIGKKVQQRVVRGLGMVAASSLVKDNILLRKNPNFFRNKMFWPPYVIQADKVMKRISNTALKNRQ